MAEVRDTDAGDLEAERCRLTIMFCDLVDSTAISVRLDPEDLHEVIRRYHSTCSEVIRRFGGYTASYEGDGMLVYFGYPHAREGDVERAARAALGIIEAFSSQETPLGSDNLPRPAVRIGIATGDVLVGRLFGDGPPGTLAAVGETPNLAARLQSCAEPNTVAIALSTKTLLGGL